MADRYYGWRLNTKRLPRTHRYGALRVPDLIDFSMYKPSVIDQLQVGRCTGCGIGGHMSTHLAQLGGNTSRAFVISPDDLYNLAREKEGDLDQDAGAEPSDVFLMVQEYGAIPMALWPISPTLDTEDPLTPARLAEAIKYPNFTPVTVDVSDPTTALANILDAMAGGNAVSWGFPWFAAWENYDSGLLPMQTALDQVAGGHDTFSFQANVKSQFFYAQNSWGTTEFGQNNEYPGCYKLPFAMIPTLANMGMSVEYATFDLPGGGNTLIKTFSGAMVDITDSANPPIAGALLSIQITNPDGSAGPVLSATTGQDGTYSVQRDLPQGTGYSGVASYAGGTIGGVSYDPDSSPVVPFDVTPVPPPPPPPPNHKVGITLSVA